MKTLKLGDEVVDSVSGFKGIAVARYEYLNGCVRIEVQPKVNEKGEYVAACVFDLNQLQAGTKRLGGPKSSVPVTR